MLGFLASAATAFAAALVLVSGPARAQSAPARAGEVSFVAGAVQIASGGAPRAPKVGDAVLVGDTITTGASGHLHVKTVDNGFLALRPNSRAAVEIYEYDAAKAADTRIRLRLDNGVLRTVSGQGAQAARDKFRLNTPVAAIGIRGTDFTVVTSDAVTRTAVRSGSIVVAGFDGECRADALGPCSGAAARLLAAEQTGRLLELRRGERAPTVIEIRTGSGAPDEVAPPLPSEPRSSVDKVPAVGQRVAAVSTEAEIAGQIVAASRPLPVPIVEASPLPPPAPEPPPPAVTWGRWRALANQPAGVDPDAFVQANGGRVALNALYLMARSRPEDVQMPNAGRFEFRLDQAEAFLLNNYKGTASPATIDRAGLTVDFAARQFETSLDVQAGGTAHNLVARGRVTADGLLSGNLLYSDGVTNTNVNGALAGRTADRAGYLFDYGVDPRRSIVGTTLWRR